LREKRREGISLGMSNRHRFFFVLLLLLFPLLWFGAELLLEQYEGLSGRVQESRVATWYKGNTHTHTLWSDGNDFPEMITDWYKEKG
jgi:hypothetical protein